jgi:uncharacterized membrane protein
MESIIIASFRNLQDAENGLDRIRELNFIEDIVVYNLVLVEMKNDAELAFLYSAGPDTMHFPEKGAMAGSIIGAFTGPFGILIGLVAGGISGSLDKYNADKIQEELSDKIRDQLKPGEYAMVMHVKEDDPALIDFYLGSHQAVITRAILEDFYETRELEDWVYLVRDSGAKQKHWKWLIKKERKALGE